MALKSTIHKAEVSVADMDRHYYAEHSLTIAQHPSETEERMMVRLLAFMLNAHERLTFGKGLSTDDEPDLWHVDYNSDIRLWIEVGLPDEDKVKKASARCKKVAVVAYGTSVDEWYKRSSKLKTLSNVEVWKLSPASTEAVQQLCERTMQLQLNIMDSEWTLIGDQAQAVIEWEQLQ